MIKSNKLVNKKSQDGVNFCYAMSQTYGTNYTTAQKLVNWTIKLIRLLKKLQKSIYQDQDVEDGLQSNHYHCV